MQPGGRKATAGRQAEANLQSLREAAAGCRECPLGEPATQTVWGEGTPRAKLMLVGEQPGDREDLEGRPFVGPAGRMLDRALQELGWRREGLYVTNAVKHFKFEMRGKRRMHKTPGQREAMACLHWLESEIASLGNAGLRAVPSKANFILVLFEGRVTAEHTYKALMDHGFIVRWLPGQGLPHGLRISIGTEAETRGLAAALRQIVSETH